MAIGDKIIEYTKHDLVNINFKDTLLGSFYWVENHEPPLHMYILPLSIFTSL